MCLSIEVDNTVGRSTTSSRNSCQFEEVAMRMQFISLLPIVLGTLLLPLLAQEMLRQELVARAPCLQAVMTTTGTPTSAETPQCRNNVTPPCLDLRDTWLVRRIRRAETPSEWVQAPLEFLPDFRSPCWVQNCTFFCLPAFYVLGVHKCGTSELFGKIVLHPDVHVWPDVVARQPQGQTTKTMNPKRRKEPHWWQGAASMMGSGPGQCEKPYSLREYMALLQDDIAYIQKHPWVITGEASVSLLSGGLYGLQNLLQVLWPQTRYLVIIRDPVERAWSQYMYRSNHGDASDFHKLILTDIRRTSSCLGSRTPEQLTPAASSSTRRMHSGCFSTIVGEGVYAHRIWPWLRDLPHKSLLVVDFALFVSDQRAALAHIYAHLGLDVAGLAPQQWASIVGDKKHRNQHGGGAMLPETRRLLAAFYAPHNAALARMLRDSSPNITGSWARASES